MARPRRWIGRALAQIALLLAAAMSMPAMAQSDPDWADCVNGHDWDRQIAGCNRVLQRGDAEPTANQAIATDNRAVAEERKGDLDRAMADYNQAIRLDPQYSLAWRNRAKNFLNKGDYERAIADSTQAIRLKPGYADALLDRGSAYFFDRDYDRAFTDFDQAVRINPQSADAVHDRGLAREKRGDLAGALSDFSAAIRLQPGDPVGTAGQARVTAAIAAARPAQVAQATPTPAPAAPPGRRIALVIGNSHYQAQRALPNPANDAADVAAALGRIGFSVTRLDDVDFNHMRLAVRDFARDAPAADLALVYYAGHGIEIGGDNYLIPIDAELQHDTDAATEAIPLRSVMDAVGNARQAGLVVLDACRDNPFSARMQFAAGGTRGVSRGLGRVEPSGNLLVAYAAREGTVADDGNGRNSPFTAALLRHIEQSGIDVRLLFGEVRDDVLADTNRRQQPVTRGELGGSPVYLRP
jgi:tetratricopeptide (TPR) repeat protein